MEFAPGTDAVLDTTVATSQGQPIDADTLNVDLFDADGSQVVDNGVGGVLTQLATGTYRFTYPLPLDAPTGLWRIEWEATVNDVMAVASEVFDVAATSVIIITPGIALNNSRLRSRLGEPKVDPDGDGSETMFNDTSIAEMLDLSGNNLNRATLEGWLRKEARYSRLIDIAESGSERKLSQKFKNAKDMVAFWKGVIGTETDQHATAIAGRVAGRVASLRCRPSSSSSPYPFFDGENVRAYPTHRLICPAILG